MQDTYILHNSLPKVLSRSFMYLHPSVGDGDGLILCERVTHKVMTALILVSIWVLLELMEQLPPQVFHGISSAIY
jgi:hypothetical protein